MPVHHGRQIPGALAGDLPYDVLGDGREGHRLVDREERDPVPGAGHHEVLRDVAQLGLPGRQRGDPGAGQEPYEGLGVGRVTAPREAREHQLAAGEIAAGVPEVGGHHTAHGAVQLVPAAEQPQTQRVGVQQCAQAHSRRRRSCLENNVRFARGACP